MRDVERCQTCGAEVRVMARKGSGVCREACEPQPEPLRIDGWSTDGEPLRVTGRDAWQQ